MIDNTIHRKLKIEQHETYYKPGVKHVLRMVGSSCFTSGATYFFLVFKIWWKATKKKRLTTLSLRQTEHIRDHLWHRYSRTVCQVMIADRKNLRNDDFNLYPTPPEHLSSIPFFSEARVAWFLVFCVLFCRSLFVLFHFFIWSLTTIKSL